MKTAVTVALDPCFAAGPFVFHDLAQAVEHATRLGFDALELFPGDPSGLPPRDHLGGLAVSAVGSGAGWVKHKLSFTSPDAGVRRAAADFVRELADAAREFAAPVIIGSMQGRWGNGVSRRQALDWLGEAVAGLPGPLLLEPLNRYESNLLNTLDDGARFLDACAREPHEAGVLADLFHMNIEEAGLAAALRSAGESVGHVHIADSNRRPAGLGHTDFGPVVAALRDIGYAGYLSAECLPFPDPVAAAAATMAAVRRLTLRPSPLGGEGRNTTPRPTMLLALIPPRLRHGVKLGVRSLIAHRLRSGLTTLGIVLGVMSVIVMLAVGEAARFQALKQLEDLGANTIILRSVKPADMPTEQKGADLLAYGVTYADLARIAGTIPTVTTATPLREYRKTVWHRDKKVETRIVGVTPDFFAQSNIQVIRGRGFEPADERQYANVCVLGAAAAEILFPATDPIGKTVGIDDLSELKAFTVVGLTAPKTLATGGADAGDADFTKVLFIPFASDRVRFGRELISVKAGSYQVERLEISRLSVQVAALADVPRTAQAVQSCLDKFHPNKDVVVSVPLDLLQKAEQTQRLFTLILGAIAGVSLLVGGIGIMNIMLATVTERTREIGVRRALGAKRRDIAFQFLIETVVLSCGGGLLGVGLGVGLTVLLAEVFGIPTVLRAWGPGVAFSVSVAVGLASGLYPARAAARLDPIEALRHS